MVYLYNKLASMNVNRFENRADNSYLPNSDWNPVLPMIYLYVKSVADAGYNWSKCEQVTHNISVCAKSEASIWF